MIRTTTLLPTLAILGLALTACQPAGEAPPDPAAIQAGIDATNRAAEDAVAAGDVAGFVTGTYTADAVIMPPDGPVIRGHQGIREFWAAAAEQLQMTGLQLISESVTPLSADAAYEIGRGVIETANGTLHAKYVVIWNRTDDGRWLWDVDIWNAAPAPESGG